MKITPQDVLKEVFIGKTVKSFGLGNDGERADSIGKKIIDVRIGNHGNIYNFDDCREDSGMLLYFEVEGGYKSDPVFVYENESVEME